MIIRKSEVTVVIAATAIFALAIWATSLDAVLAFLMVVGVAYSFWQTSYVVSLTKTPKYMWNELSTMPKWFLIANVVILIASFAVMYYFNLVYCMWACVIGSMLTYGTAGIGYLQNKSTPASE